VGIESLCWLSDEVLATMEPVIRFDKEHAALEGIPDDAAGIVHVGSASASADDKKPTRKPAVARKSTRTAKKVEAAEAEPPVASQKSAARKTIVKATETSKKVSPAKSAKAKAGSARPAKAAASNKVVSAPVEPPVPAEPIDPADLGRPAGMARPAEPDDLKLIVGIGPQIEIVLNDFGVYRFAQIAGWSEPEREWVDKRLMLLDVPNAMSGSGRPRLSPMAAKRNMCGCSAGNPGNRSRWHISGSFAADHDSGRPWPRHHAHSAECRCCRASRRACRHRPAGIIGEVEVEGVVAGHAVGCRPSS
jgi:predicted flap endonuclease-1-like 5' DNA nuclease